MERGLVPPRESNSQKPGEPGFPGGSVVKNLPVMQETASLIPGSGRSPEKEMATHSSISAWEIPWTEEPGVQQTMGLQKAGHGLATKEQQWI